MNLLKVLGLSGTPVNFQPIKYKAGILTPGTGVVFSDGSIIPEDPSGLYVPLPYTATLWLNEAGDIRVIPAGEKMTPRASVLFKNCQGDFHRVIKGIVYANTTITDLVIDYLEPINAKKL